MLFALLTALVAASHPQVFFSQTDVPALKEAANGTHREIAQHITTVLDAHLSDGTPNGSTYDDARYLGNEVAVWAFGYQITGNTAYAAKARTLLLSYVNNISDWGFGEVQSLGVPDLYTAHMLLGTSIAYDWLYSYLSASDRAAVVARIGTVAQNVADNLPNAWYMEEFDQNHNWIDTAGLGMAALALAGEDARATSWRSLAEGNLQKLKLALGPISDGTFHEGLPYQGYGLSMAMPFWIALSRAGADYTDLGMLRGVGKMWLYTSIPDNARQAILPYGDFTGWPRQDVVQILRYSASRFHDGLAEAAAERWLAAGARLNFLPEMWNDVFEFISYDPTIVAADVHAQPLQAGFADLGAAVLHSSWDSGDLAVGFKAGPFGGRANFERVKAGGNPGGYISWGHDHNDDMSFWLFGKGTWLAPEAMGYLASTSASTTSGANSTSFHNSLLIDGAGELGDQRTSDTNQGLSWFFQRDAQQLVTPAGTADYAIAGGTGPGLFAASVGLSRWDRLLVLARSRYVLVRDDVVASSAHAFDWTCHFTDGVSVDTASGWVQGVNKNGQSLGVRMVSPASWTATTGSQTANLMDQFDPDGSTSYVRVRPSTNAASVQFLAALVPVATSSWGSRTTINALSSSDPGAGMVVAPGSALEERWLFQRAGTDGKAAADLALTGSLAGMAGRNAAGTHVRAALFGAGRISDQSGARELLYTSSATAIEANVAGTTLQITGENIADFRAFAPGATQVTLNGVAVNADFSGGVATYPSAAGGSSGGTDGGTGTGGTGGTGTGGTGGTGTDGGTGTGGTGTGGTGTGTADAGSGGTTTDSGTGGSASGSTPDAGPQVTMGGIGLTGCSSAGGGFGFLTLFGALALLKRRKR